MYLPINPYKLQGYWNKFSKSLSSQSLSYIIEAGKAKEMCQPHKATQNEIDGLLNRLQATEYVRIGSQHLHPFPSHFAIKLLSPTQGVLVELITIDNTLEQIKRDVAFIIDFVFFDIPALRELIIPLNVEMVPKIDFKIQFNESKNETLVIRK